jgi:hypothetical protein
VPDHLRRIITLSRHRPVAVVDGSLIKNLNKTGVRLWTAPALDQHSEPNALQALAGPPCLSLAIRRCDAFRLLLGLFDRTGAMGQPLHYPRRRISAHRAKATP